MIKKTLLAAVLLILVFIQVITPAFGHPGSGIAVDGEGHVYFVDTGHGVWKIDKRGQLTPHQGSAFHWMAIDLNGRLAKTRWPSHSEPSAEIERVGVKPTLILSSDFPVTVGPDGALYYPELGSDQRVQVIRLTPAGDRSVLATLPAVSDGGALRWLNGIAAGPDGSIYYSENTAVRRITPRGTISTIASKIVVPDCVRIPGSGPDLGAFLRGLDVAPDGTIYVAASACGTLLRITPRGEVTPILRTTSPWSPTGVAITPGYVYVLEYLHTASDDRREWIPRVRRLSPDGKVVVLATVERGRSTGPPRMK
ncbi:MAG: hypothetical protein AABN33_00125 [Acidobacteriota bacterium]